MQINNLNTRLMAFMYNTGMYVKVCITSVL